MRVLHVLMHSVPDISGYTLRSQEILTAQKKLGLEIFVITSPYQKNGGAAQNKTEMIQGIPHFRTNLWGTSTDDGKRSLFYLVKKYVLFHYFKREIARVCQSLKPDLIHGHSYFYSGYPASVVAREMKIPYVYELRGLIQDSGVSRSKFKVGSLQYRYIDYMERKTFNVAAKIVTISKALRSYLLKQGWSDNKIVIVPNGVDTTRFHPVSKDPGIVRRYNLFGKVVLGFIGSFFVFEGLEFLLNGFRRLVSQEPNLILFLIGGGEMLDRLKHLVRELKLEDSVIVTGRVNPGDIIRYYSVIDICVYPRLRDKMTEIVTPLKPLEAMAMGKAVIGSDIGGHRELIHDGQSGLLFRAGDDNDFVSKCLQMARNVELRGQLAMYAKNQMVQERDWLKLAEIYVALYKSISGRGKAA